MKSFKTLVIVLALFLAPFASNAQVNVPQGGTGLLTVPAGSILFGGTSLRLATSSALQFNAAASRLTVTNASTTGLTADTICLTGDTCITSWPSGGSGIANIGPAGQFANGPDVTLATSSDTNVALQITGSGDTLTFTSQWLGTLADGRVSDTLTIGSGSTVADGALSANVSLLGSTIGVAELASADFGDFTCNGSACTVDANAIALSTDTTGNYLATLADDGQSTITVNNSGSEGAAVTLRVIDVVCTDCLGATEIADSYLLNTGDTGSGNYSFSGGTFGVSGESTLATTTMSSTTVSKILSASGSEAVPAYSFVSDSNTGMFLVSGGVLGFVIDGTGRAALNSTGLYPYSNDASSLGLNTTSWSDLWLASGAVIGFANTNYTITHSSGLLTFSGAQTVTGTSTLATTTSPNLSATNLFTFNGITGDSWDDFCVAITGGASLCDGSDAAVGGGVTFGSDNQIPFTNALGTDFEYSSAFTFTGTHLINTATSTLATTTISTLDVIAAFNADTSTALAANGSNCSSGSAPLGVDASGAAESCFDVWTESENTAAAYFNTAGTGLTSSGATVNAIGGVGITANANDLAFDATEITGGTTWDDGGEASVVWTWNISTGDPQITFGNDLISFADSLTLGTGKNFTIGTTQWNNGDDIDADVVSGDSSDDNFLDVGAGGTGVGTLTDGGVLLGNATGDLVAMAVLGDGAIIVGDGTTDPVALTAFTSSTGDLIHEAGGLEADVSGYTNGLYGQLSGVTADVDTIGEIETAIGGATNILIETEIDASSELAALMDDETGSGLLVFGTTPSLTNPTIASSTNTGLDYYDGTPNTDHYAVGPVTNTFNAGTTTTVMDLLFMASDGEWRQTDADAEASSTAMLAIGLAGGTDGNALLVADAGSYVRDDTWNWTPGQILYVGTTTAGSIISTPPSGTDDVVRVVGYAVTADVIKFLPSGLWVVMN